MQLVANGPDIPEALLRAQEEGRVVFFCGAGISYPAGLPGFKGLVEEIYRLVGTTLTPPEQEAFERDRFDSTLELLERRLPGQRLAVRRVLADALQPNLRRKGARDTHAALLQLGRSREGALRLVSTNFDRIFARLTARTKPVIPAYTAPLFPTPKASRWNGLVYLHGLLPEDADPMALNRLVLTSGDFGLAYLTERWAARFVSELFRNFIVCFVGYSINDPVLRYMMDALAADRMLGEVTPQAYAFGDCEPGQDKAKTIEWDAKGVVPILYEASPGTSDHSRLHRTLKAWAEIYRDGVLGKERIVVDYAITRPSGSTRQDDYVGRMLWALSDESGLPAKRFADFDPVPSLDWLEVFSENRYRHADLARFGVPAGDKVDAKLRFGLIRRPASYIYAPWMMLVSSGPVDCRWDDVMCQLARWLVRHLDDPSLILWLSEPGGRLDERLVELIKRQLDYLTRLEREGKTEDLVSIRAQAPNAIPRTIIRRLWNLLLTGRVKSAWHEPDLYRWLERLKRDGLTASLRFELREALAPKISLTKPSGWLVDKLEPPRIDSLEQIIDCELVLTSEDTHSQLLDLSVSNEWRNALPTLLEDFQQLLADALGLLAEVGKADDRSDPSHWSLPSLSSDSEAIEFRDWVVLIEFVRDAWLALRTIDPSRATWIAQRWFTVPYPTFKRLALFAARYEGCIPADCWADWLMADDAWWLWSIGTQSEVLDLLAQQGSSLPPKAKRRLEAIVLAGPSQQIFRDNIDPITRQELGDRWVLLYLSKLQSSGARLGTAAARRLNSLSVAHSKRQIEAIARGSSGPDTEEHSNRKIAPRERNQLVTWLKRSSPLKDPFYDDNWREVCGKRFFHCAAALCDLAREGFWPAGRWQVALQAWSEEGRVLRSWRFVAPLVQIMPCNVVNEISHSVTWWLEVVSKSADRHEEILLDLCRKILELPDQDTVENADPVTQAINHPIGHVARALLNVWFKRKPNDNDGLLPELEPLFTQLCDTSKVRFRYARVILASRLVALFRVDRRWTEAHLLPLFDWARDAVEARGAWSGFLWSPRLYRPLLMAFKSQLLDTVNHYLELAADHGHQYATFLTYAALDPGRPFSVQEFRAAFAVLPKAGLRVSAQALVEALEGAGDQREEYWTNRIRPLWQDIWPKSRELTSEAIAKSLARLSIAARGEFSEALAAVHDWLRPVQNPHLVVRLLHTSGLAKRFPESALHLLHSLIDIQASAPGDLSKCLTAISEAAPPLSHDARYQRLAEYVRRRGA